MKRLQILVSLTIISATLNQGCTTQTPTRANWQYWGQTGIDAQRHIKGSPPALATGYYRSNHLVDAVEQANFDANINAWNAELAAEKQQETLDAINSKLQE